MPGVNAYTLGRSNTITNRNQFSIIFPFITVLTVVLLLPKKEEKEKKKKKKKRKKKKWGVGGY